jgi:hypothetical protein
MKTATLDRSSEPTHTIATDEKMKTVVQGEYHAPSGDVLGSTQTDTPGTCADGPTRKAATLAGVTLLLMSALSAIGYLVAVKGLVTQANATRTATNIMDHQALFRFGIQSLILVGMLDVVVAWALYRVFRPVSQAVSKLATWLRIAYAGIFVVATSQLVRAVGLLNRSRHLSAFSAGHLHTEALQRINAFTNIWDAGLILFGLHLLVIAYLGCRSEYVPRVVGALLAVAGCGYLFDSFGRALSPGSSLDVSAITGIGEFVFALWLLLGGRRIELRTNPS